MLDRGYLAVPDDELQTIQVLLTLVAGKPVAAAPFDAAFLTPRSAATGRPERTR